ncbi:hypothetical protein [Streptomyces tanashiensis]|uniref:Uncharacterized protein n=1 Tax=Streptomyces tanashiensis TaxID=67367 RepID=A0ABY6QTY4_9ACTN|nr:hypothetical protein [Streptomyces tanashiensis]UZX21170.1 hypothetical protein LDH80_10745 [Streptomyces tanashiensis]
MAPDDDDRTTFLFYAPERQPHAWSLDLAGLGEALRQSFTEARYKVRQDHTHQGEPYLSFWAATDDGTEYDGTATVHGRDCVMLADTTAGEAAPFLIWLRDNHLPSPDLIRFSSEAAVDQGIETDWRLPGTGDAERVADELRHHLAVVDGT